MSGSDCGACHAPDGQAHRRDCPVLVDRALSGRGLVSALLLTLVARYVLTLVSYGTGSPGGIFAPLLVSGVVTPAEGLAGFANAGMLTVEVCDDGRGIDVDVLGTVGRLDLVDLVLVRSLAFRWHQIPLSRITSPGAKPSDAADVARFSVVAAASTGLPACRLA